MKAEDAPLADERRQRRNALACFRAALAAVDPLRVTRDAVERLTAELEPPGRLLVAAVGKAAPAMMQGALAVLDARIARGLVIGPPAPPDEAPFPEDRVLRIAGAHPLPDRASVAAGRALLAMATDAGEDDLLLVLLSGGASSLATVPVDGITADDLARTTDALLRAGASIDELNAVRKHLDAMKGGRLAHAAARARVLALIISDVVGDRLDVIASGPLSPDPTTFGDALAAIDRLGAAVPAAVRATLENGAAGRDRETPKPGDACFRGTRLEILANHGTALGAAGAAAADAGYRVTTLNRPLSGEARAVGASLGRRARMLAPGDAFIAAGETVVTVRGDGRGGRCQELALAAALEMDGATCVLLSASTDGVDGPTGAAGAFAGGGTTARAANLGLDAHAFLDRNDSFGYFDRLGDLLITGPTGTNVGDLVIALA